MELPLEEEDCRSWKERVQAERKKWPKVVQELANCRRKMRADCKLKEREDCRTKERENCRTKEREDCKKKDLASSFAVESKDAPD